MHLSNFGAKFAFAYFESSFASCRDSKSHFNSWKARNYSRFKDFTSFIAVSFIEAENYFDFKDLKWFTILFIKVALRSVLFIMAAT